MTVETEEAAETEETCSIVIEETVVMEETLTVVRRGESSRDRLSAIIIKNTF